MTKKSATSHRSTGEPAPEPVPDAVPEGPPEQEPVHTSEPESETGSTSEPESERESGPEDDGAASAAAPQEPPPTEPPGGDPAATGRRRRRNRVAAALIGVLTMLLGFAFAVQVRSTDTGTQLSTAREEDLVRILDELNAREDRLRQQISEQRAALDQLGSSDSRSATALDEARQRAQTIGILNGTIAAQGPGIRMVVRDPVGAVRVADLLDAIEELRGAGAETMQIDGVRVGVSTAVTGEPGALRLDDKPIAAPYEILAIGSAQNLETAMNIPGGVVQRISGRGGSVQITEERTVVVDALRPLDRPQYASPTTGG